MFLTVAVTLSPDRRTAEITHEADTLAVPGKPSGPPQALEGVLQQTHRFLAASLWQARGVGSAEFLRARRNTARYRPPGPKPERLRYHLGRSQHSRHPVFVDDCCEIFWNQPLIHHPSDS